MLLLKTLNNWSLTAVMSISTSYIPNEIGWNSSS